MSPEPGLVFFVNRTNSGPEDWNSEKGGSAVIHEDVYGLQTILHLSHAVSVVVRNMSFDPNFPGIFAYFLLGQHGFISTSLIDHATEVWLNLTSPTGAVGAVLSSWKSGFNRSQEQPQRSLPRGAQS